ncbi:MAG: ACP S-malonyltransferase, partial [Proteobacteria bacterium]|nr:ACP S-malonyltransferase [Pseudomonadota bacterium]
SQYVGMSRELLEEFPYTKEIFEEAEDAAQLNIRKLCLDGPEEDLKLTANTQPCLLSVSLGFWRVLKQELGLKPDYFAGHSLGEYSALVAAGKLSLSRAAYLVRKRGEAMQRAVPEGVGAMAAVMKMPADQLEALCAKHSRPDNKVEIANYNSDAQLVIAGHAKAVLALCEELQALQIRYVDLPVSAPFHSSLMKPARLDMQALLEASYFAKNSEGIIANFTGSLTRDYGPQLLIDQIDGPVRWIQSIDSAKSLGVQRFIEIGPGKVLFALVRRMVPREGFEVTATDQLVAAVKSIHI